MRWPVAEIRHGFGRGETTDEIVNDLVARFGPQVRAVPVAEGLGLLASIFPGLLGVATLFVLASVDFSARRRS
jgi:cytochrome c-type biogenesis protein CcmH/NrfF